MLSFAATVDFHVLLLILSVVCLHAPRRVAGAPTNATLRLDSPLVAFTPGWRVATFAEDGSQFAFADGLNEEVRITLPQQTTEVYYQGYKVAGGALFLACVDCDVDVVAPDIVGLNAVVVDAHDSRENGTQPPETLFSFTDLDPTTEHTLTVFNLADPAFNNTSQVTFDSVVVTLDSEAPGGNPNATSSGVIVVPNLPTLTVTAIESSTTTDSTTTAPPIAHGPITTGNGGTGTVTSSPGLPGASQPTSPPPTATPTDPSDTTTSDAGQSTAAPGQTGTDTAGSTGGGGSGATITDSQSPGASPTDTQTAVPSQPNQSGASAPAPTDPSGTGTGGTSPVTGAPPTGTAQPTTGGSPSNGSGQPTAGGNPSNGAPQSSGGSPTSPGEGTSVPSVSPIFSSLPPGASGTSPASNSGAASSSGVSKPVIIAVAVVASLFVLGLLGAVLFVLVRNRGARPPNAADPEGSSGLMKEAAPAAMVSAPAGLAPMRPQNPFADTVAPDIPLDAPPLGAGDVDDVGDVEDVLAQPQPSLPPPPIPPKSPLRGSFNQRGSPWLSRVPCNSNPSAPS